MAIKFSWLFFFLKIVDFQVDNNILWDVPDCTRSHHFSKSFPGEHAPDPLSNSMCTQFKGPTHLLFYYFLAN